VSSETSETSWSALATSWSTLTHTKTLTGSRPSIDLPAQKSPKINLEKCVFCNKEVSYLGFTLTLERIKPGKNKLKAIKDAKPPTDIKTIRSFVSLCNFFRMHITILL
jgi:hypothetical protein